MHRFPTRVAGFLSEHLVGGGFVLSYGSFVGGAFVNETGIVLEPTVEAICARNSQGGATSSSAAAHRRFQRQVSELRAALG